MRRFLVEVTCQLVADDLDAATDTLMGVLLEEPGLIDPDLTAELANGSMIIASGIDAADEPGALELALVAIRSAAHKAGARTATWEADLDNLTAFVRPFDAAAAEPSAR